MDFLHLHLRLGNLAESYGIFVVSQDLDLGDVRPLGLRPKAAVSGYIVGSPYIYAISVG